MKRLFFVYALIMLASRTASFGDEGAGKVSASHKGVFADNVIFTVGTDQAMCLEAVVEGRADVCMQPVPAAILNALNETDKAKLDIYSVPTGSWSLLLNPIPNKAPYTWKQPDGATEFNPFAIREVRYAINWLVNRKQLVDQILLGDGEAMFTMATPGQPGTYRYNLIPAKLGMTAVGNERNALADIDAAMKKAAALPENKGKLVKKGQFWQYNGNDVLIRFLIRVDDPAGRLPAGRYIADQLEKAGLKVDRLEWDRSKCGNAVYGGNPADYRWSMYTEGWGTPTTRAWWDGTVSQMYAPYYGYMPGGGDSGNWNYENARIDELGKKGMNGQFLTEKAYWEGNLEALELGVKDAVRIYLCSQFDKFVANKARFNSRMAYGVGEGLNGWSIRTADIKPDISGRFKGKKVLRVVMHSVRGSLFMGAMDPVGLDGFSSAGALIGHVTDSATFEAPNNGLDVAFRSSFDGEGVKSAPKILSDGALGGNIAVPAKALIYDSADKAWKEVGKGITCATEASGEYMGGKWHNGEDISAADVRYAIAFQYEWSAMDGEQDKYFDPSYSSTMQNFLETRKGYVFNGGMKVTSYEDYFFAADKRRTAASIGAVDVKAGSNPDSVACVPWEIYEALALLVAEGSKSGTRYSFNNETNTEVDVFLPKCVADIKAKLAEMIADKHVPACLKGIVNADEAVKRCKASLDFINQYGHAYISNGPFFIAAINRMQNSVVYNAVSNYLWDAEHWRNALRIQMTKIDNVKVSDPQAETKDAVFEIAASMYTYPETATTALGDKAKVEIRLQLEGGGEKVYAAKFVKAGQFKASIPAADLARLAVDKPYTVIVMSSLANEAPAVYAANLVLF